GPPSGALAALLLLAGIEPASSSRLASTPDAGPLGRVQLPFLGLKLQAEYDGAPGRSDVSKPRRALCEEAMKEHQERLKGARVLLVEDNAINQDLATNVLARAGHRRHCGR
ncbi:MAG TPA: hypothetical protein VFP68_06885, partial [Burkholderiaceae bacterium]|nr:hypothetical protein [Burkholderiaceae bacterium]